MRPEEPTDTEPPDTPDAEETSEPASVFGNLPRSRPGARSPRRDEGTARRATSPKPSAAPRPTSRPEPAREREPTPPAEVPSGGGIEDVAWAGVAAAAEAATIGVRLATRALETMRDAVDRR